MAQLYSHPVKSSTAHLTSKPSNLTAPMDGHNYDPYRYHGQPPSSDPGSAYPPPYAPPASAYPPAYAPPGSAHPPAYLPPGSAYPPAYAPPYQTGPPPPVYHSVPSAHYNNPYPSPHLHHPSFGPDHYPPPASAPIYRPSASQRYDAGDPPPENALARLEISGPSAASSLQHSHSSARVELLHGNLEVWIHSARNLPNMEGLSSALHGLLGKVSRDTSDPYVTFSADPGVLGRTHVVDNDENPVWNQHFLVPIAHRTSAIVFSVKDDDVVGSAVIGTVRIPAQQIRGGARVEGAYPVMGANGKPCKGGATLRLSVQYFSIDSLRMYHVGIEPGPEYSGVPGTYFPLRRGCRVTLYQDAHVPNGSLPDLWTGGGRRYEHGRCWHDICKAMKEARRLIYITGWSVYQNVRLVRDAGGASGTTLGELLKSKSQEGVRVLMMVWDDPTSQTALGLTRDGLMDTHDEETRKFFKHSSVEVLLCPRSSGKNHGLVKQGEAGLIYTHHQKSVIVDSDAGNNRRKLTAFVGGLDLCQGRYDTPKHPLFSTLQTVHKDDYNNPTFKGSSAGLPREPWHDLHSRIDGPAAYDVLQNFEERWRKASKPRGLNKLMSKQHYEDRLLKLDKIREIMGINESLQSNDNDPETWHVQIFRSIDSNSVKGFPKDPTEISRKNLVCGKNMRIDMSIHTAYVKAIRSAQHFIYIENQYFLGSSFNWSSNRNIGADNLIPMELALKIADKIKAKERFSVYVVVPMWPEGVPTSKAIQRILYWQNKTMEMMYQTIYHALLETGLENEYTPQDYLNFFCLGNREPHHENSSNNDSGAKTPSELVQKSRRFMIYVHSKGMIVDDEYVIMGSANINQRSLDGSRDTEIAMGAYQPHHIWARETSGPRSQVHCYRMSLWAEHLGIVEDCFLRPESLECVRRVRALGEYNWEQFASDTVSEMPGHLLKYPVFVDSRGNVRSLPGCESFLDVGGNICGSFTLGEENLTI